MDSASLRVVHIIARKARGSEASGGNFTSQNIKSRARGGPSAIKHSTDKTDNMVEGNQTFSFTQPSWKMKIPRLLFCPCSESKVSNDGCVGEEEGQKKINSPRIIILCCYNSADIHRFKKTLIFPLVARG